jgi:type I restriction enzyme, S subunit
MNNLIPLLRFKEFSISWSKYRLGDFTKINQGLQIAIAERLTEKVEGSHFYITNEFLKRDSKKSYFIKDPPVSVLCEETDLLMTRTGNTGQVVTGVKGAFHNNFFKIKLDSNFDRWFLFYFLTSHQTQHTILKLAGTSTIPDLNHGDFYKIKINVPSLPEQQKIASFLSAVDEKIQQLTRKKELLEQYKKGVMQQLFSGKLRFKDENGKDYPKWEEKRLDDAAEIIGGGTPDTSLTEYWDGDIQWFTPTEISERFVSKSKRTISRLGLEKSSAKLLPAGAILFTSRATIAELSFAQEQCTTNQGFQSLVVNTSNDRNFFFYWIKNNKKVFVRRSQGSTFLEISKSEMIKIKILLPCEEEQIKIGSFLSSIDNRIESVTNQITQTQAFKKGLLQQMFV